jgi:SAM-dependent methyltransferase
MDRSNWDDRYVERGMSLDAAPNEFLVETVTPFEPGTALDLAAGQGRNSVWLARQGWRVTAVDWSEVGFEHGRELAAHHGVEIGWVVADLREWRAPAQAFDLVAISYLQPPAELRARVWKMAAAAVAPGGHLVVIGHDTRNFSEGYGGPPSEMFLYRADEVVAAIGADLEIVESGEVLRTVPTDDGDRVAIDNRVVAVRR